MATNNNNNQPSNTQHRPVLQGSTVNRNGEYQLSVTAVKHNQLVRGIQGDPSGLLDLLRQRKAIGAPYKLPPTTTKDTKMSDIQ